MRDKITVNREKNLGEFKIMNAVNNGPFHSRHTNDQLLSNFEDYKAAGIPYARNHDAAFCSKYGGEHANDISAIFPNFDADPYDENSYDFVLTDEYIFTAKDAGTEVYFRLGQKIEHYKKKYGVIPPKDFKKWAVICEHIIRHYNEGWANGYELNMKYWEIWNEPDLDLDEGPADRKRMWTGDRYQFFDMFEITAKHLKKCFPNIKVGGPAFAGQKGWVEDFFRTMRDRDVKIDFISWHIYAYRIEDIMEKAEYMHGLMEEYGYGDAESILNEWNYVKDWTTYFVDSIKTIISIKGAAFVMATMIASQYSSIDMLMYYDARPCVFNGLFDFYSMKPLKSYYTLLWYSYFYKMENVIESKHSMNDIYALSGVDKNGKTLTVVSYYTDEDNMPNKTFEVDYGKKGNYEIYLLDDKHNGELIKTTDAAELEMAPNTCVLIKEI